MDQLLFEIPIQPKAILQKGKQCVNKKSPIKKKDDEFKKTHHNHIQYKDTVENAEKYIEILSEKSFDRLGKNLDVIREQMGYAIKQKKYSTFELLYEWEKLNIEARLIKFDKEVKK